MNAHRQPVEKTDTDQPVLRGQRLSPDGAVIHSTALFSKSHFEPWTEVGEGSRILNSTFEAYSYCDRFADIANTTVGRFSNIAAMTRIGPTDHPFTHAAQHHILYRSASCWPDAEDDPHFFAARAARRTTLGPRFSQAIIDRLLTLAWWGWSHDRLRAALADFRSLKAEAFLEKYQA